MFKQHCNEDIQTYILYVKIERIFGFTVPPGAFIVWTSWVGLQLFQSYGLLVQWLLMPCSYSASVLHSSSEVLTAETWALRCPATPPPTLASSSEWRAKLKVSQTQAAKMSFPSGKEFGHPRGTWRTETAPQYQEDSAEVAQEPVLDVLLERDPGHVPLGAGPKDNSRKRTIRNFGVPPDELE